MRLINTTTLEVSEFSEDDLPRFAILSHTWAAEEVTLQNMQRPVSVETTTRAGYQKIQRCCLFALEAGFNFVWIDTCCIDKTSSSELSEAINSMYRWYEGADVCYTYLADVTGIDDFSTSRWFERGWTLQELIAPPAIIFLNKEWTPLGTKETLQAELAARTRISERILTGQADLASESVARKMSWAAGRKTSRLEDRAYSLLGIFGINMPLIYGEGENAFIRLQEEILRTTEDHSIFAWSYADGRGGILATTPDAFGSSSNVKQKRLFSSSDTSVTISSKGVHLSLPFIGTQAGGFGLVVLHCVVVSDSKQDTLAIRVKDEDLTMQCFVRVHHKMLPSVDLASLRHSAYPTRKVCIRLARVSGGLRGLSAHEAQVPGESSQFSIPRSEGSYSTRERHLLAAASSGQSGVVWLLLTQRDLEPRGAVNAMTQAIRNDQEGIVEMLLTRRTLNQNDHIISTYDDNGLTPLICAVQWKRLLIARMLVEAGADMNMADKDGRTPVVIAFATQQYDLARLLVGAGADTSARGAPGNTPLWYAVTANPIEFLLLLLGNGVDPTDMGDPNETPLAHASGRGFTEMVEWLLRLSPKEFARHVDGRIVEKSIDDDHLKVPLLRAAQAGHDSIVLMLLKHGADKDVQDQQQRTPLFLAIQGGHVDVIKTLILHQADVNKYGNVKSTTAEHSLRPPLSVAVANGQTEVVELLLRHGAETNVNIVGRNTPILLHAVMKGYLAIVKVLVEHGAIPEADGKSALVSAYHYKKNSGDHKAIYEFLVSRFEKPSVVKLLGFRQ